VTLRWRVALLGLAAVTALGACSKKREEPIARLETIVAQVEKLEAAGAPWRPAAIGDTFVLGSAVRTGKASHARLRIGRSGTLDVDPEAVVHFTRKPGQQRDDLRVETGTVEIEAGDDVVGFGDLVLEPHGRARVANTAQGLIITVTAGQVLLEEGDPTSAVEAGKRVTLPLHGKPVVASPTPTAPGDAAAAPPRASALTIKVTGAAAARKTATGTEPLPPGEHHVEPGTELAVPAGSTVEVSRDGARAVVTGKATVRVGDPDGTLVTATDGVVALYADAITAVAAVPGGTISAGARPGGSEAIATVTATGTTVEARRGETVLKTATGDATLVIGETAVLAATGTIALENRAPARATMSITAGESPVLHDPQLPTAVGVKFGTSCTGAGVVEVAKDRSFKRVIAHSTGRTGSANVLLAAGSYAYRVRCDGGGSAAGTLRVVRDSGRTPLPKAAARTSVEADGREYTILYQNLLPELTLSWRNARSAASYTFVVKPKVGAAKRFPSPSPRVSLRAGELGEGSYKFWVETPQPNGRSEETRIVIEFDNAAASASLESVEIKDGKARVKGVVIEGSSVTAAGAPVELDRHRRFVTELAPRDDEDGIAVRIAHPKLGVHYYVVGVAAAGVAGR